MGEVVEQYLWVAVFWLAALLFDGCVDCFARYSDGIFCGKEIWWHGLTLARLCLWLPSEQCAYCGDSSRILLSAYDLVAGSPRSEQPYDDP